MSEQKHIYPVFDRFLQRADKERLLGQRARVVWMTGLSGSGKTTLAVTLERGLHDRGYSTQVLDGDNIRTGINGNLGFSEEDRMENIRRIAEVAKLSVQAGMVVVCCFVSPTRAMRELAQRIIGKEDFLEVYVNCPLEICEERDVKGLYAKARKGEIKNFTGIDAPFEAPEHPSLEIRTHELSIDKAAEQLLQHVENSVRL